MKRFIVETIEEEKGHCTIRGTEARHIGKVLRMGPGDRLVLMDRAGLRFLARVESVRSHEVRVSLEKTLPAPAPSPLRITLAQAQLRSGPMDFVIQKATELGVSRIVPFCSERTVVRPSPEAEANRLRHWREVALGAAKQSNRDRPPEISPLSTLKDVFLRRSSLDDLKIALWEAEQGRDLKTLLRESTPGRGVVGVVGPEGGFSEEEMQVAEKNGFLPVSLGHRILRAETAALTLVAVLQYEWGDLSLGNA